MDTEVIVPKGLNRMGQRVTTQSESCSPVQPVWGALGPNQPLEPD